MYFAFCFSCSWARYSLPALRRRVRPCCAGREGATLERLATLLVLEDVGAEATRDAHLRAGVTSHVDQVLRRLGWRQPLCGTGVTSLIEVTSMPVCLDAAHGGVAARAGALDLHFDAAQTVLHRGAGGLLGGHLGGERGALARALEADATGRRPRDDVALGVGDRHDRVVERALDVHDTDGDVLALALAGATPAWLRLGHYFLTAFFLLATVLLRALAGAGVGVGALTTHRQALAVTDALAGSRSRSCA